MLIIKFTGDEIFDALPLVCNVFLEYEAINYKKIVKRLFNAIYNEEYIMLLTSYGEHENIFFVGIIATRNSGSHIAIFFVDGAYQKYGIGRKL